MPISKSINLLQNPIDIPNFKIPDKGAEEYYIQALANLGQRMGLKGDGITYRSFSFLESFTNEYEYSTNEYIGYLRYVNGSNNDLTAVFGVVNKDLSNYISLETSKSINNTLYFPDNLSLSVILNNIEKYSKNSIIINENGIFTIMVVEKYIGYDDDDPNNSILQYYKFDVNTNKLIYSAKTSFAYSDGISNYYSLIRINKEGDNNYKMSVNLLNSSILSVYKNQFEEIYKFSSYNESNNIPFTFLKPENVDINVLESYNNNFTYFESNSPIAIILNHTENKYKYSSYNIDLTIDTNNNELIAVNPDEENIVFNKCKSEYNVDIIEELKLLNYDITELYYVMFNYYNEKFYTNERSKFIQRILCKIYEFASNYEYNETNIMYFPLDYTIDYMCNNSDEMQIYFSNNIYITYTNLSEKSDIYNFWENNTNIVFDYDNIEKIKVYTFNVLYNSKYSDIINSINIRDIYTMPYINANENWSINNADTKVKARGDDAGNPNIIIIYSKDKNNTLDSYKVLTSIVNNEIIENCEFEKREFLIDNALFDEISNIDIKCYTYMPKINEINYSYFKNSIIINICELDCLENEGIVNNYLGSNILSLWHLSKANDIDNIKYMPILKNNANYALPFGSTINILNETNGDYIAKLNAQDILLLKSVINTLAQENMSLYSNNWLVIKNKIGSEYNNITSGSTYSNNLNAIIQYNDNVIIENDTIKTNQSKKYIDNLSNLDITNSIYPKYEVTVRSAEMTGTQIVDLWKDDLVQRNVSKIVIDNETITNIDEVYEEIASIVKDKTTETFIYNVKIESENKLNTNYNEYVFNSNIPSLDLKEIFIRNFDVLNRVNILSIDNNGNIYNGYIGSSFNEQSKSTMHIGTSKNNINIGSDTLMKESDKMQFKTHDKLSIDFNNIEFNSVNSPISNKPIITKKTVNGIIFNFSSIFMLDSIMTSPLTNDEDYVYQSSWNLGDTSLFCEDNNENYYVCINNLLSNIFNETLDNYDIIINEDTSNLHTKKINRNNELLYFYRIDIAPFNNLLSNNICNFGQMMDITYYKTTNNENKYIYLYIHINNNFYSNGI